MTDPSGELWALPVGREHDPLPIGGPRWPELNRSARFSHDACVGRTLSWVDRQGKQEPLPLASGRYAYPHISPDGTRVALDIPGANRDIWFWNLQRLSLRVEFAGPDVQVP